MICEGQRVPHAHKDDAREYRYLGKDSKKDTSWNLCSRCIKFDRARGFVLERVFPKENTSKPVLSIVKSTA